MTHVIVIDDFYANPEAVRRFALDKVDYLAPDHLPGGYPGTESRRCFVSSGIVERIEGAVGCAINYDTRRHSFGVFSKTYAHSSAKQVVHVDATDWTGIVYLSAPADCRGGTSFFRDQRTGLDRIPDEEHLGVHGVATVEEFKARYLLPTRRVDDSWDLSARVGMKFNRMLLFRSGVMFHAATEYFGDTDEKCRLMQLFFFNERSK